MRCRGISVRRRARSSTRPSPLIREQLAPRPTMPATAVAERIGWERSITVLRERVAQLRPLHPPQDPAGRTAYEPGGRVQDDFWFPPAEIPLGHGTVASGGEVPPVLVMASGYSRWMLGLMIPSRHAEDLVLGTWRLLQQLGGVPGQLVWDNEGGVGKFRGFWLAVALSRQFAELRGLLGCEVVVSAAAGAGAQTSGCILHLFWSWGGMSCCCRGRDGSGGVGQFRGFMRFPRNQGGGSFAELGPCTRVGGFSPGGG